MYINFHRGPWQHTKLPRATPSQGFSRSTTLSPSTQNLCMRQLIIHGLCVLDINHANFSACRRGGGGGWHPRKFCLSPLSNCGTALSLTLSQWSSSRNPVAIQCVWNLDPSLHWNATGERIVGSQCVSSVLPVVFKWLSSDLPVCFNYAN